MYSYLCVLYIIKPWLRAVTVPLVPASFSRFCPSSSFVLKQKGVAPQHEGFALK